jgi:hypothetical protein
MKGYVFQLKDKKDSGIFVCGVEGAGKRLFIQAFRQGVLKNTLPTSMDTLFVLKHILFVQIIDGVHSNNLAEEQIFEKFNTWKSEYPQVDIELTLLINKIDIFMQDRKNHDILLKMHQTYCEVLAKHTILSSGIFPISLRGINLFNALYRKRKKDDLDIFDLKIILTRISRDSHYRRLPDGDFINYINNNPERIKKILGETTVAKFIKKWKRKKTLCS